MKRRRKSRVAELLGHRVTGVESIQSLTEAIGCSIWVYQNRDGDELGFLDSRKCSSSQFRAIGQVDLLIESRADGSIYPSSFRELA